MSEDAPHYGPMTELRAREILRDAVIGGKLERLCSARNTILVSDTGHKVSLGGYFDAEELEAIAWWMRNQKPA